MKEVRLPPALRPWEEELSAFPLDVALSLQAPIRHLSAIIGPLAAPPVLGEGEPDGFDGVDRRGPFDRLLLSEWVLASELPDEFMRRAADREQSFLKLRRTDPGVSRRTVVLLDSGPTQLGEPRLAQLVALIVLARRARCARADFRWGILQKDALYGDLASKSVHEFRRGATRRAASQGSLEGWSERLQDDEHSEPDDLWLVGDVDHLPGATRLLIEEVVEPGVRALRLTLKRRGTHVLTLDLPSPEACIQAFRSPLKQAPDHCGGADLLDSAPIGPVRFSPDGNRLIVVMEEGAKAFHVPNSVASRRKSGRGKTRVWRCEQILAVGFRGRRFTGVFVGEDGLVHTRPDHPEGGTPVPERLVPPDTPAWAYEVQHFVLFIDGARQLWSFPKAEFLGRTRAFRTAKGIEPQQEPRAQVLNEDVLGWDPGGYYRQTQRGIVRHAWPSFWAAAQQRTERSEGDYIGANNGSLVLGAAPAWGDATGNCWAHHANRRPGEGEEVVHVTPPEGVTIQGTARIRGTGVVLLGLDETRKCVMAIGAETKVIATSTEPIEWVCQNWERMQLAWKTDSGRIVVLDNGVRLLDLVVKEPESP